MKRNPLADSCVERGLTVATALSGSWRPVPPELTVSPVALARIMPLLLSGTAAALAYRRVHQSELRATRPARQLRDAYRQFALESAAHEHDLQQVLPLLRSAGVEPLLIKGWSVARHYPESGLRPYCDLDLCVHPDQAIPAKRALTDARDRSLSVELHQGIPDLKDRTWDEAFRRSRLIPLGDVDVRVLCPEDLLRLSCLHQMRHGAVCPLWLCDLGVLLEGRPKDFDWEYCLHGHPARAAWILRWLGLACRLLDARLDEPTLQAQAHDLPPWLVDGVLTKWSRPAIEWNQRSFGSVLDPIKSAYRRRLPPYHSLARTQWLGLLGRVVETPTRLRRQWRRWRRVALPFGVHDEKGD